MKMPKKNFIARHLSFALQGLLLTSTLTFLLPLLVGCEERATPENTPGPKGCGLRDPSQTAPGMLSWAQQKFLKTNGPPSGVRVNKHGGNDWLYRRSHGNQFGEEKSLEIYSFNAEGLLVGKDKEIEVYHGK